MNQAETNFRNESVNNNDAGFKIRETKSSSGCCCGSGALTSINKIRKEKTMTDSQNETKTTTVTAPEIVCGGCAGSIKKALGAVSGISEVEVDVATKKVTVNHDENVSHETIVETLDRAGYSVA